MAAAVAAAAVAVVGPYPDQENRIEMKLEGEVLIMKFIRLYIPAIFIMILVTVFSLPISAQGAALTPGNSYTVSLQGVNSDGTLTGDLGIGTTAVADANGKITFTLSGSVPTAASYNFLLVTVTDGTITRKSVIPAPAAGGSVNLGVSETSTAQANALISAFEAIGSDNPLMAAIIVLACRSAALNEYEAKFIAVAMRQGVLGPQSWLTDKYPATAGHGLVPYLEGKGYSATDLSNFYSAIQSRFYQITALMKESVDNYFANAKDATEEAKKRGEAAGKVMDVLVEAADAASIDPEHFLNGFPEMGFVMQYLGQYIDYILGLIGNGGDELATANAWLNEHFGITVTSSADFDAQFPILDQVESSIGSSMQQGVMKAKAKAMIEKYEDGLVTLNATASQISRFTEATTRLTNTMISCFQEFDEIFANCDPDDPNTMPSKADMEALQNTVFGPGGTMDTAFDTYMTDAASTVVEIDGDQSIAESHPKVSEQTDDGLRWKVANALGLTYYKWADRYGVQADPDATYLGDDVGKFWGKTGEDWIPITMAVVINWAADVINNGGYISYYGTGEDPDDADLTTDYSSLYQHTGAGGRTTNNPVDIPDGSVDASINMSWLKEVDHFFVSSKNDVNRTVTDLIKNYTNNEHQNKLFGSCNFTESGPVYTQLGTIASNTDTTLTLAAGVDMNNINAGQSYFIYTNAPARTNFVSKCPVKNKAQITMANIKAIRQDIEIIEFAFFEDMFNKTSDTDFQIANATKKASLDALVSHIGGMLNSDGDPITTAQKKALIMMFVQPDF